MYILIQTFLLNKDDSVNMSMTFYINNVNPLKSFVFSFEVIILSMILPRLGAPLQCTFSFIYLQN